MSTSTLGERVDAQYPRQVVKDGARQFSYREAGAGPVIMLFHGIGSGSGSWFHQFNALSDRYRLIAWDAPGYGQTSPVEPDWPTSRDYGAAQAAFIAATAVEPQIMVGHSLGSLMTGGYIALGEARPKGVVLADPANGYGFHDEAFQQQKLSERVVRMDEIGPKGVADTRSHALLSPTPTPEALELVRWNMAQLQVEGHRQAARFLATGHLAADLHGYDGPAMVLWGDEDWVTPEDECRKVAAACKDSRFHAIEGAGHASYVEKPDRFNQCLLEFFAELGI